MEWFAVRFNPKLHLNKLEKRALTTIAEDTIDNDVQVSDYGIIYQLGYYENDSENIPHLTEKGKEAYKLITTEDK